MSNQRITAIREIQDELAVIVERLRILGEELPNEPHTSGYALGLVIRSINRRVKRSSGIKHPQSWDGDTLDDIIWWLKREE